MQKLALPKMALPILAVCLCLFVGRALGAAPGLAGDWRGEWTKDGDSLPVILKFTSTTQGFTGALSSDALQVSQIPLGHIGDARGRVHFEVQGDAGSTVFDGAIVGHRLSGVFVDHEHHDVRGRFEMVRSAEHTPPVRTREVVFENGAVRLAGTLLLPPTPGRHRAVLFLQGSGPEGRWANRYLAEKFAQAGIVALIYDKRGVAASTGDWRVAGFDTLARDGAAGVRFLRGQREVDPSRVGLYGHSQGGTITPLVANHTGGLAFVIASAAGGLEPAAVETFSVENSIGLKGLAPIERADAKVYVEEVVKVAYGDAPRSTLDYLAAKDKDRRWFFAPPPPGDSYWTISRQIAHFRPFEAWRRIKAPVLLVYGGRDERVPPHESIRAIQAALKSGGAAPPTVQLYPHADHIFAITDSQRSGGWPKRVPNYAETLIRWIKGLP